MIAEQTDNRNNEASLTTGRRFLYFLLPILVLVGTLVAYKSSAALIVIGRVSGTGIFTPRGNVIPGIGATEAGVLTRTLNYFLVIWPALLFGVLISGAVSTFISPRWLARLLEKRSLRSQAIAGIIGAPLMLCSCCVAPIFTGVYERSARLGPSLGLMLAAPALNPAALILTFMLFDYKIGATRVAASVAAVLFTGMIADRIFGHTRVRCDVDEWQAEARPADFLHFLRACARVTVRLIPVIIIGVLLSMIIAQMFPVRTFDSTAAKLLAIMIVAAFAVPLALPTFFEIPLALILIASGAPPGAAVALLIAGPAVNLPSLFTIMRSTNWKVAALVAASMWILAVAAGTFVSFL
ncbi:MAG TPA: permease [Pyrinomonadaceae bacterium]